MPRSTLPNLAFWCLTFLLSAVNAHAQAAPEAEIRIDRLSVEDGLAQSIVTALVQDRHGFLWIGTEGGLDRYDGYAFVPYRNVPGELGSLSSSFVNALVETPDGAIWVGTHGAGLNRLDPASGVARRLRHVAQDPSTISSDRITALFADREGRLWAGTENGLDRVDLQTARVRRTTAATEVVDIAQDPASGDLWVATHEGLLRVDPASGRILRRYGAETLGGDEASAVWADPDGTLWVGTTDAGLTRLNPGTGLARRFPNPASGASGASVQDIMRDATGTLWVATLNGLARLDVRPPEAETWTVLQPSETDAGSISAGRTRTLLQDRGGLVWVGTWGAGLNSIRRTAFRRFSADVGRDGLSSNDVMGMAEAPDGTLWVGTYDRGLNRVDLASGVASQDPAWPLALRENGVRAVAFDARGALWATGNGEGLWRRDPDTGMWKQVPFEDGSGVESVTHVSAAPDGSIWAATYGGGPCHAAPGAAELTCPAKDWTGDRALRSDLAYTVYAEADGSLWVSLWGSGADLVDPARGRIASFENRATDPASLTDNNVTSFFRDASGEMWLTTYGGGLNRLLDTSGGGRFAHITEADGLPNGTTYGILPDARGQFWVSTNRGLARLDAASGEVLDTFGPDDGLPGEELNGYSFLKLRDGRMAFGGLNGFALFDPASMGTEATPPEVAVTAVRVLGQTIDYPATASPPALRLSHRQSAVAFDVAALDFAAPEKNRYSYWLEGLNEGWSPASTRRTAAYTNLSPGTYTFRVRASGADGAWNETALAIPITVRPAWWQTWLFRIAAGLGLLALIVLGVREVSQRRLRADVQRLETEQRLQAERERISRDLHDHVGGQLSGLIASAELARLQRRRASGGKREGKKREGASSQWPVEDAASGARGKSSASPQSQDPSPFSSEADAMDRIEEDARETMRQLRETVWALHHEAVTLADFRDRLDADIRQRLRGHDLPLATVELDGDAAHVLSPLQALHLYRIAREAVTNSLKHADAAHLTVTLRQRPDAVTVEIHDDGTFRLGDAASGEGAPAQVSGFGMGSMRARTEELGGQFEVETDGGTTVRVTVPTEPVTRRA